MTATATAPTTRTLRIGTTSYPVLLPKLSDPRLHLAAVVITLQTLGQTVLGFDLSIAQILISIGTCALIDFVAMFVTKNVIAWPASAMLTGNGVAILLRVPGTQHGDWWSLNGIQIYVAIAALSVLSKYAIRYRGRHLFNPANFGLTIGLLVLGSQRADPQDLWWGPISPAIVATLAVITAGAIFVTARNGLIGAAGGFFVTLTAGAALLAATGHAITARWHFGPIVGKSFLWTLMSSPEILIFSFFMVTDPRCIPSSRRGKVAHGVAVGALATCFIAPQTTEFATKVGILAGLVVVSGLRPLLDRWFPEESPSTSCRSAGASIAIAGSALVATAALVLGLGQLADSSLVANNVTEAAIARPDIVAVPKGAVPHVVVGASATRLSPQLTTNDAEEMGHDLVEALLVEERARQELAPHLATGFLSGNSLATLTADIAAASQRPITITSYSFKSLEVVLVPDPERPQAPPQLGLLGTGTATTTPRAEATTSSTPNRPEPIKIERIFLVNRVDGHWTVSSHRDLGG